MLSFYSSPSHILLLVTHTDLSIFSYLHALVCSVQECVYSCLSGCQDSRLPIAPTVLQKPHAGLISPAHALFSVPPEPRNKHSVFYFILYHFIVLKCDFKTQVKSSRLLLSIQPYSLQYTVTRQTETTT